MKRGYTGVSHARKRQVLGWIEFEPNTPRMDSLLTDGHGTRCVDSRTPWILATEFCSAELRSLCVVLFLPGRIPGSG
jgi:hypothetical protein